MKKKKVLYSNTSIRRKGRILSKHSAYTAAALPWEDRQMQWRKTDYRQSGNLSRDLLLLLGVGWWERGREWYCRDAGKRCETWGVSGMTSKQAQHNAESTGCAVQRFGNLRKHLYAGSQGRGTEVLFHTLSAQTSWLLLRITLSYVVVELSSSLLQQENGKPKKKYQQELYWHMNIHARKMF